METRKERNGGRVARRLPSGQTAFTERGWVVAASTDETPEQHHAAQLVLPVNTPRLCTSLAMVSVVLTLLSVATNLYYATSHRASDRLQRFLDVNGEGNLPTWYSVVILAAGAAATAAVAARVASRHDEHEHDAVAWVLLAALITVMSIDEMTGLHEAVGKMLDSNVDQLGIGQYAWILPGAVVVVIAARVLGRAVTSCPPRVRRQLLTAAALFASAALGLEAIEAILVNEHRNVLGDAMHLLTGAQELLEMLAVVLFLRAMLEQAQVTGAPAST
jgi:hypothetical protein